jgi:cytochrome c peroxidase
MRSIRFFPLLVLAALLCSHCREADALCSPEESAFSLTRAPEGFPPIPFPPDNEFTQARWELGKRLFYDPVLSIDSSISCGSCHHVALGFADDRALSPGVENRPGTRNASALINLAYQPYFLREGSLPTLEMQVLVPIQEENEFAHNIVDIAGQLQLDSSYLRMSMEAYGREPDAYVITRSIGTFERTLVSGDSPWDRWMYQDCKTALSPQQNRGRILFFSDQTNCSQCHSGLNFTNYAFENNGLYRDYADPGRMRFTNDSSDLAKFKVPTLRNIAVTAPYMHDGSLSSLEEVVEHYNSGGKGHVNQNALVHPLRLTDGEKRDLVSFLEALTDPGFLSNQAFAE